MRTTWLQLPLTLSSHRSTIQVRKAMRARRAADTEVEATAIASSPAMNLSNAPRPGQLMPNLSMASARVADAITAVTWTAWSTPLAEETVSETADIVAEHFAIRCCAQKAESVMAEDAQRRRCDRSRFLYIQFDSTTKHICMTLDVRVVWDVGQGSERGRREARERSGGGKD